MRNSKYAVHELIESGGGAHNFLGRDRGTIRHEYTFVSSREKGRRLCVYSQLSADEGMDLLLPECLEGGIVGVFKCYLDDSKDSQQSRMVVCAGWIGERNTWIQFWANWNKRLAADGIAYFKTSEYKMLKGQFERFRKLPSPEGRNAARAVRDDLLALIRGYDELCSVGVCVPMDEWNAVASRPEAEGILERPYHRAMECVWHETIKRAFRGHSNLKTSVIGMVHDDGPDCAELANLYGEFKKINRKTAKHMVGFACLDDKVTPPLQAADLIANHSLEIGLDWLNTGKGQVKQSELESSMGYLAVWREDYAKGILHHELRRRKRPIPVHLEKEIEAIRAKYPDFRK